MGNTKAEKIGWIGLGNMGKPMVQNLINAGFDLIAYNRSPEKAAFLTEQGIQVSNSIADLVNATTIIFTMVSDDEAVNVIYNEIFQIENIKGKLFIDMSTISKQLSLAVAEKIKSKDAGFLDAPVLGSTKPATEGTLVIVVGGDD